MSFILDALYKAEKEKKESNPLRLEELIIDVPAKGHDSGISNLLFWAAVLSVSAVAIWLVLDAYSDKKTEATTLALKQKQPLIAGAAGRPHPTMENNISTGAIMEGYLFKEEKTTSKEVPIKGRNSGIKKAKRPAVASGSWMEGSFEPKKSTLPAVNKVQTFKDDKTGKYFILEGILFHNDVNKRSAMIRGYGDGQGSLVKVGDTFKRFKVSRIEASKVTLIKGDRVLILNVE